jgi:hypothetical protein
MKNTIKPDNYIIENELQHTNYFICIRITCGKPMYDCINLPTMKVNTVTFQKLKYKCQARRVRVHVFVC